MMEPFAKMVISLKLLTIFPKSSVMDAWQVSEYASETNTYSIIVLKNSVEICWC